MTALVILRTLLVLAISIFAFTFIYSIQSLDKVNADINVAISSQPTEYAYVTNDNRQGYAIIYDNTSDYYQLNGR